MIRASQGSTSFHSEGESSTGCYFPVLETAAGGRGTLPGKPLIEIAELLGGAVPQSPIAGPLRAIVSRMLGIDGINQLYSRVSLAPAGSAFYEAILNDLKLRITVSEEDLRKIPTLGPLVIVANHPFGAIEGIALAWIMARVRPDVRVMANYLLQRMPQMREVMIPVDPFGGAGALSQNLRGMREALAWLHAGGALGVFPAGEVSHWDPAQQRVLDPPWNPNVGRMIRRTKAAAVPLYFDGANGFTFQLAGMLHPRLRTARLGKELLNKRNGVIEVRIGSPVSPEILSNARDDKTCIDILRGRVYLLSNRKGASGPFPSLSSTGILPLKLPVAAPRPSTEISAAVEALPPTCMLTRQGDFVTFVTNWQQSPEILREIGRLREITFRGTGEGTGKPLDLDRFDHHYDHLFVWNESRRELVGAYRLARVHDVLSQHGVEGLYTASLFRFEPAFFRHLGKAIELGRSFVRKEYQRFPAPLMLLWKGIGQIVLRDPTCTRLIGPVSISSGYSPCSRQILVDYLSGTNTESSPFGRLHEFVRPRKPLCPRRILGWEKHFAHILLSGVDEVSSLIAELESDGKGVPVLLRHYLKLGGKILSFNVDPHFANVLDGLILVDLLETDARTVGRYLGKEGAQALENASGNWARV